MKRTQVLLAVQLGLGLLFAGLGHYFVAALRPAYPLDGFFFYAVAAICFIFAWRTARREKNAVWAALLELWRGAWQDIRAVLSEALAALRRALPYISTRAVVIAAVALNVSAAVLALLLPALTWLWGLAWAATVVVLIGYVWPRSIFQRPASRAAPRAARTYAEPAVESGARANPIALMISIGLLLLGQLLFLSAGQSPGGASPLAQALDDAFQLRLPGAGLLIWSGVIALAVGAVMFAIVTRRCALSDYPPLSSTAAGSSRPRGLWLVLVALAGTALWLFALKSIAGSAPGTVDVWPWLIALSVIGACWWQVDRRRGVRLALHLERREAALLSVALVAVFAVLAFQIGQIPNSLWGDEGAFFTTARDVARGTAVSDLFGLGTYAEPAATTIFQSWWINLLGPNVTAWRLSSVIAAWLAAIPFYFLVRSTLGKRTAWIALAFYAVSPWVLTYARLGYSGAQGMLPVVLALALTWLAVRRDSRLYAFLAGGVAGLSFFTPAAARMAIVLVPLWLVWMWITRRVSGTNAIGRQLAAAVLGIVAVSAPPIVYGMAHVPEAYLGKQFESSFNDVFYARDFYPEDQLFEWYGPIDAGQRQIFYNPQFYVPLIGRGVIRTALAFHLPALVRENYLVGSLADPFGILYVLGLAWSVVRLRRPGYAIWPIWLLLGGFLAGALSAFPPRAALLLPIAPALIALSALGLTAGVEVLANVSGSVPERMKSYGLVGVTLILALLGLRAYFVEMPRHFPPDLENMIFWQAQQLPDNSDIVLLQPDGVADDFLPWGLREVATNVRFHLLKKDAWADADWSRLCPGSCRVAFSAADREAAYPYLEQAFGQQATAEYPDAEGAPQAYIFVAR